MRLTIVIETATATDAVAALSTLPADARVTVDRVGAFALPLLSPDGATVALAQLADRGTVRP